MGSVLPNFLSEGSRGPLLDQTKLFIITSLLHQTIKQSVIQNIDKKQ